MDTLLARGHRLEFAWFGSRSAAAPTLVFLHEGLGCVSLWRDFPAKLAQETGWPAFVYSRSGYGGSEPVDVPRPLSYMHEEALLLPAVLDAAGIRDAVLIGHSDGGSIALLHAASDEARRVRAVITEAAHVFVEDLSVRSIEQARVAYLQGGLRTRLARHHGENVDCAFWGWNRAWLDPGFRAFDLTRDLPHITAPVLALQGADDPYGTLAQVDAIVQGCPRAHRELISECGHEPHREQEAATLAAMARFLRGLPA